MGNEDQRKVYEFENKEWLASIDYIIENEDADRVNELIELIETRAKKRGINLKPQINTPYINTIRADEEEPYPGDRELERKIKNIIRWNAMAMVVQANKKQEGIGGHHFNLCIGGYTFRGRLQPFLQRKRWRFASRPGLFPRTCFAGRLFPCFLGRPVKQGDAAEFSPGTESQRRLIVLPTPAPDARILALSNRLHGTGTNSGDLSGSFQQIPAK